jgi:ATP-dependent helicase/nuclease subunit A
MDTMKIKDIIATQQRASDISQSVWVSASAGSGKTTVLTNRLIVLLLNNIQPSKILCITFTKNAAAEMRNRINEKLSEWILFSDEKLKNSVETLIGKTPNEATLQNARTLFAKILDNADELKILTIHAFCQQIMKRFPFEAGIIPNFEIADERLEKEFLLEATKDLLTKKTLEPRLQKAIKKIAIQTNQKNFNELLSELLNNRNKLIHLKQFFGGESNIIDAIYKTLGLNLKDTEEKIFKEFLEYNSLNKQEFEKIYETIQRIGTLKDKQKYEILKQWANQPEKRRENFKEYKNIFITQRKKEKKEKLITDKPKRLCPQSNEILLQEQNRIYQFVETLKSLKIAELTKSLLILSYEILQKYSFLKLERGILDYNDLIIKTKDLLSDNTNSQWVSFKLDEGIHHILVDEAQDTSPYQWNIIKAIVDEFFQQENCDKTILVVGDEKQSIFSFQGADPKAFAFMHNHYKQLCQDSNNCFETIPFVNSFRSLSAILQLVDKIFEPEDMRKAISQLVKEPIKHNPLRIGLGKIEVWPLISKEKEDKSKEFTWQLPFQSKIKISNIEKLAKLIAEKIQAWIKNKKIILDKKTGEKRLLRYSDIMILLRKRGRFADFLIKALNKKNIPVSGIDRLKLTENIIIKDLIALGNFILFPEDNLNLANIIKSPIIGLNEDDLFNLCAQNKISLWQTIKQNPQYKKTKDYLEEIIEKSKLLTPYELFVYILDIKNGRDKIINRFTETAHDLLNEFLNLLKAFEKNHIPSLNNFMNYLKIAPITIKRDMEQTLNEVRVMTTHGAKGLQAPIIFLPDSYHSNIDVTTNKNKIYWLKDLNNNYELPFWNGEQENNNEFILKLKEEWTKECKNEYLRLLYVALTRAENELYICGWCLTNPYKGNWYNLILDIAAKSGIEKKFDFESESSGYIIGEDDEFASDLHKQESEYLPKKQDKETDRILQNLIPCKKEKESTKIIHPSEFYSHRDRDSSPADSSEAIIQGQAAHKLLEILPQIKLEEREQVLDYYLHNSFNKLKPAIQEKIRNNILKILNEFKDLFVEESRSEVPIAGYIDNQIVSGQIDRLIIKNDKIMIVDYKNSRKFFKNENEIPEEYKKQLWLYKELTAQIYPAKEIECYILWTNFCKLSRIYV